MPNKTSVPKSLRPYVFHGLNLQWEDGKEQATGDCPWCGREGKFSINVEDGLWRCFVCNEGVDTGKDAAGGGCYVFLRMLHEYGRDNKCLQAAIGPLAEDRRLKPETLDAWGLCVSILDSHWLIPGYTTPDSLSQLYSYRRGKDGKAVLLATNELEHTLFGLQLWDDSKPDVYLCEGPWDAMALWQTLKRYKRCQDGTLTLTSNEEVSLLANANVLAVPGCTTFKEKWARWFTGRRVFICYDSDHPRINERGVDVGRVGYRSMQHVARTLLSDPCPPKEVHYLNWGEQGYDPSFPSGFDVRDYLCNKLVTTSATILSAFLSKLTPIPEAWVDDLPKRSLSGMGTRPCEDWKTVENEWKKAMQWRHSMSDALASMLAVVVSTDQVGNDQLFLQVIGEAGSGKTQLCDALLTSPQHCFPLEHFTGFHSGIKGEDGEDLSLLARINHKTLVTSEGDVIMSNPKFPEIMSQCRRIFDGVSQSTYKNSKEDRRYTGLRTPWIMAGTPALMNMDQSRLGDRFIRIFIDPPGHEERQDILRRVGHTAYRSLLLTSNGDPQSSMEEYRRRAYQLTGGYVQYLRENAGTLLSRVKFNEDWLVNRCAKLAEFTALMRARPETKPDKEVDAMKEEPTRLQGQFVRLSVCLAAVLGKWKLDESVLRIVRKVALDTARGRPLEVVKFLYVQGAQGAENVAVSVDLGVKADKCLELMKFLKRIGVVISREQVFAHSVKGKPRYYLSPVMLGLCRDVLGKDRNAVAACRKSH